MHHLVNFAEKTTGNGKRIGFATLTAEKSLNALNLEMVDQLLQRFQRWNQDPAIVAVVLQGAGEKAFCAGGNIKQLFDSIGELTIDNPYALGFFETEYRLDYLVHTFSKPILCWGHGIVMGGGLGLLVGASHRVVTETAHLAMPEISIGLYPDVGGSWYLNRMPGRVGLYLGLTGTAINAADALFLKLADFLVLNETKAVVFDELLTTPWSDSAADNHLLLSELLRRYTQQVSDAFPPSLIRAHYDLIQQVTDYDSVSEIADALVCNGAKRPWLAKAAANLAAGSPTSAHLIYRLHARPSHLSLKETFKLELGLSMRCLENPDFKEGVRAVLIDKDRCPHWTPNHFKFVSEAWIDQHFTSPWTQALHPLADL